MTIAVAPTPDENAAPLDKDWQEMGGLLVYFDCATTGILGHVQHMYMRSDAGDSHGSDLTDSQKLTMPKVYLASVGLGIYVGNECAEFLSIDKAKCAVVDACAGTKPLGKPYKSLLVEEGKEIFKAIKGFLGTDSGETFLAGIAAMYDAWAASRTPTRGTVDPMDALRAAMAVAGVSPGDGTFKGTDPESTEARAAFRASMEQLATAMNLPADRVGPWLDALMATWDEEAAASSTGAAAL